MSILSVCLDLGNSSLKIGFGVLADGEIRYGKITEEAPFPPSYFPSSAYYDEENGSWYFGAAIEKRRSNSFSTVVKIKDLLSLLLKAKNDETTDRNRNYYFNGKEFPKFLFPPIPELKQRGRDLRYVIRSGYGFESPLTPQQLCEEYFAYVARLVNGGRKRIAAKFRLKAADLDEYKVSLIYPNGATKEYVREYTRLVEQAFGKKVDRAVSSTRALAYYAKSQGKVKNGDEFLVFDIGDENVSVSKASLSRGDLLVDGVDGHSDPLCVGGNDIDENVVRLIESKIERRETIGTPSFGEAGHVTESGLTEKNYLLTKDVKDAKVLLSSDDEELLEIESTPIDVNREVFFRVELSRNDLNQCSGVTDRTNKGGVASRIADYMIKEANQLINRRVNKVLIAGGVIETAGLFNYLRIAFCKKCRNVQEKDFLTFERSKNESDPLGISEFEDSSYAASLGGCYLSIENIPVKICLPLSFAANYGMPRKQYAVLFAGKGTPLAPGKNNRFSISGNLASEWEEKIISLQVTPEEIERKQLKEPKYCEDGMLIYDADDRSVSQRAETYAGMKVLLTNKITLTHRGRTIDEFEPYNKAKKFSFVEGIDVDEDGRARIFIEPGRMTFRTACVRFKGGFEENVDVSDIKIKWEDERSVTFDTNTGN